MNIVLLRKKKDYKAAEGDLVRILDDKSPGSYNAIIVAVFPDGDVVEVQRAGYTLRAVYVDDITHAGTIVPE